MRKPAVPRCRYFEASGCEKPQHKPRGCRKPMTHAVFTYRGTLTAEHCELHARLAAEPLEAHGLDPVVLRLDDPELDTTVAAMQVRAHLEEAAPDDAFFKYDPETQNWKMLV